MSDANKLDSEVAKNLGEQLAGAKFCEMARNTPFGELVIKMPTALRFSDEGIAYLCDTLQKLVNGLSKKTGGADRETYVANVGKHQVILSMPPEGSDVSKIEADEMIARIRSFADALEKVSANAYAASEVRK